MAKAITERERQHNRMMNLARPLVAAGKDWQQVQWELLNGFDFLTDSDDDEEWTRDIIRACEDEMQTPDLDEYDLREES